MGGPGGQGSFGFYGMGGGTQGRASRSQLSCRVTILPFTPSRYAGEKVIDFSNPDAIQLEHDRAFAWASNQSDTTGRAEMDFADWWDKWPGQFDPYMSALETYHAGGMPWREAIDQKAPRRVVRSNMEPVDHSYGIVDICRISEDADHSYEANLSSMARRTTRRKFHSRGRWPSRCWAGPTASFTTAGCSGTTATVSTFTSSIQRDGGSSTAGQAKVDANFHAIAGNTLFVSEAFNVPYPADRIELLKRICPPTMDVAYPVDLFVRRPAQIWNMPVERPFGKWSVLAVFNLDRQRRIAQFTTTLDAAKDLRLDPDKDYIAYEFWSKQADRDVQGKIRHRVR